MSSVYWPRPVRKRASSRRLTDWPMKPWGAFMACLLDAHGLGALLDRLDDVLVAGAAAEVAVEPAADLLFGGGRVVLHQVDRAHHHARRAEAALQPVAVVEGHLHRVQLAVLRRQALDGGDLGAMHLCGQHVAGLHRLAIDVHGAGTALRRVAADVRAGEAQVLAQELDEQGRWRDLACDRRAVHLECDDQTHVASCGAAGLRSATSRTSGTASEGPC